MSDGHAYHRAILLFEQKRWEWAMREFMEALKDDPNDALAHAHLSLCLMHLDDIRGASLEVAKAIESDPTLAYVHYAAALVAQHGNRLDLAVSEIRTALEMEPTSAIYLGTAAYIAIDRDEWEQALEWASAGLEHDPGSSVCFNARATALLSLGQPVVAMEELQAFLREDPEDTHTLATLGWAALHRGQRETALQSFSEALRVDAENTFARQGLLKALQAGNPIYALMLRYFLWVSRLRRREQWQFQAASILTTRALHALRRMFPRLGRLFGFLIFLDIVFTYLTWTADSLATMLMTFNPHTRRILDEGEKRRGVVTGVLIATGLVAIPTAFLLKSVAAVVLAFVCLTILIPYSTVFECHNGWPRVVMSRATFALAAIGFFAVARLLWWDRDFLGWDAFNVYVEGFIFLTLASNVLVNVRPRS